MLLGGLKSRILKKSAADANRDSPPNDSTRATTCLMERDGRRSRAREAAGLRCAALGVVGAHLGAARSEEAEAVDLPKRGVTGDAEGSPNLLAAGAGHPHFGQLGGSLFGPI